MGLLSATFTLAHHVLQLRGVKSRMVEHTGGPVHFYDMPGRGPHGTLVLQHGIGAESLHFAPMLPWLRRSFSRVILPDLPGHGRSAPLAEMTPEALYDGLARVLNDAVPEPAVVFGNSLGGAMVMRWALDRPEQIRALILASPAGAQLPTDQLRAFLDGFAFADKAAVLRFFRQLNPRVRWGSGLFAEDVRATFARPHMRAFLAAIRPDHSFTPEEVQGLRPPTLMLWGRSDALMPEEMRSWYRTHLPRGTPFEEPDGVGHCPQVDRPAWTARRILTFVQQHAEKT